MSSQPFRAEASFGKNWYWILFIFFGIVLHAIGIGRPFLGHFAQHQTDYATVVQLWLETGLNPLEPAMRFIALGKNRLFFGDFPLNITLVTLFCQWTQASIEFAGRGLSFLYFLASLFPIYRIARSIFPDRNLALISLAFYIFSPLTIIYSQLFLLEMSALCFAVWGWYLFLKWWQDSKSNSKALCFSAIFWAFCFMTRIYFVLLLIPLFCLFIYRYRARVLFRVEVYLFFILALLPPFFWQVYAAIMASRAGGESSLLDNLRVFVTHDTEVSRTTLSFSQIFPVAKSLLLKVATPIGFLFSCLAIFFHEPRRRPWVLFLAVSFLSFSLLFLVAPRKFIEFEYYFIPLVPIFCLLTVFFMEWLAVNRKIGNLGKSVILIGLVLLALRFSMPSVLTIPNEDRCVLPMAQEVRRISSPEARVIASHGSSSSFLYYTNRDGWGFSLQDRVRSVRNQADSEGDAIDCLERFRGQGALYFAMLNPSRRNINQKLFDYLDQNYQIAFQSDCGLIYSLEKQT